MASFLKILGKTPFLGGTPTAKEQTSAREIQQKFQSTIAEAQNIGRTYRQQTHQIVRDLRRAQQGVRRVQQIQQTAKKELTKAQAARKQDRAIEKLCKINVPTGNPSLTTSSTLSPPPCIKTPQSYISRLMALPPVPSENPSPQEPVPTQLEPNSRRNYVIPQNVRVPTMEELEELFAEQPKASAPVEVDTEKAFQELIEELERATPSTLSTCEQNFETLHRRIVRLGPDNPVPTSIPGSAKEEPSVDKEELVMDIPQSGSNSPVNAELKSPEHPEPNAKGDAESSAHFYGEGVVHFVRSIFAYTLGLKKSS